MYYSNEIVFRGHPDKVCDQISSAILSECVKQDKNTHAGIEVSGGKGKIFITGEVTTNAKYNVKKITNRVLKDIGIYNKYKIIDNIGKQSNDINMGINKSNGELGAGDQGMMFGYACNDTEELLPTAMVILQKLSREYDELRKSDCRFLPDGKAQITGEYDSNFKLLKIKYFVISYQNTEINRSYTDNKLKNIAINICKRYNIEIEKFLINPTGKFLIGGFEGDAGLTGRKIVVDTYQSFANVGGGCVDYDTEYLTVNGWKKIGEFKYGEKVAQWNKGNLEFVEPIGYIKSIAEKMYHISTSNNIDMVLSDNHNVIYRTSKNNFIKKKWKDILNEYITKDNGVRVEVPLWFNNSFNYNKGLGLTEKEIQLQVAFCADGSILHNVENGNRNGRIRVKKIEKINRLREILNCLNINYKETQDKEFSIFWFTPKILNKSLYECFSQCNRQEAEIIAKEVLQWDGNKIDIYRTTLKEDADFIQFLFASVYNVSVSICEDNRIGEHYKEYIRKSICYAVRINKYKYSNFLRKNIKYKSKVNINDFTTKDGYMYCINVPSHNLILRRNNRIFITGNCMSGKDMTKVDVSGAYKARELAKRFLRQYNFKWCEVQLSYAIGLSYPLSIYLNTNLGSKNELIDKSIYEECKLSNIIKDLNLLNINYEELAKFGHFTN